MGAVLVSFAVLMTVIAVVAFAAGWCGSRSLNRERERAAWDDGWKTAIELSDITIEL